MTDQFDPRAAAGTAQSFFDDLWRDGDPWRLETSPLDQARYDLQLAVLDDRRYRRALEVGCAAGVFTERLLPLADSVVAVDIAAPAVAAARARVGASADVRHGNVMELDLDADGPWDLVVLTETIYYLGWLYPLFHVAWLLHALHDAATPAGRLLLADTYGREEGLMSHWLIKSYRDLARNVGWELERHEDLAGTKDTVPMSVTIDLFRKTVS